MTVSILSSMTAFARNECKTEKCQFIWEIRSVNHRYLDITVRLPSEFRHIEPAVRERIHDMLARGKIDAGLRIEKNLTGDQLELDQQKLDAVSKLLNSVYTLHSELLPARVTDLVNWPGVICKNTQNLDELLPSCLKTLDETLMLLISNRQKEGGRLSSVITQKLKHCLLIVADLATDLPEIQRKLKEKWKTRIEEINFNIEPQQIAHEIALILIKSDVAEELDRLKSHLDESLSLLDTGQPVGRRMDFLMQELNREANTLGAKSIDKKMTNASIELKVLIDQIREQVQNIE